MRYTVLIPFLLFAHAAMAQLIIGGDEGPQRAASEIEQERLIQQFPQAAVEQLGNRSGGYDKDVPATPANPTTSAAPGAALPPGAQSPVAPTPPASPISKLWPADTVQHFMPSCIGADPRLIAPCQCVIGRVMLEIPHDEFLRLTAQQTIENDARLQNIRLQCAAPGKK